MKLRPYTRVPVGTAHIDAIGFDDAVARIVGHASAGGAPRLVVTPNSHHLVVLQDHPRFREAYAGAWLSVPDSVPLLWATRLLGTPLPERVNGTDLFEAVCRAAAGTDLRIFLLGGRPGAAERAREVLQRRYRGLAVAGVYCPPFGFERDPAESDRAVEAVRRAHPDILFVGLGAPKQEIWVHEHLEALAVPVSIGIGGSFELVAGMIRRAPRWMQRSGLEWLFRLVMEPRRLWRRYAVTIPRFALLIARQYLRGATDPGVPR